MANAIVLINKRAKQMVKANKNLAWKDAIQKASAEYRRGKGVSGAKKVAGKKVAGKKVAGKKVGSVKSVAKRVAKGAKRVAKSVKSHVDLHKANKKVRLKETCKTIGAVQKDGLAILGKQYAKLAIDKMGAPGVRARNKIGKEMTKVAGQMRKLKTL